MTGSEKKRSYPNGTYPRWLPSEAIKSQSRSLRYVTVPGGRLKRPESSRQDSDEQIHATQCHLLNREKHALLNRDILM